MPQILNSISMCQVLIEIHTDVAGIIDLLRVCLITSQFKLLDVKI